MRPRPCRYLCSLFQSGFVEFGDLSNTTLGIAAASGFKASSSTDKLGCVSAENLIGRSLKPKTSRSMVYFRIFCRNSVTPRSFRYMSSLHVWFRHHCMWQPVKAEFAHLNRILDIRPSGCISKVLNGTLILGQFCMSSWSDRMAYREDAGRAQDFAVHFICAKHGCNVCGCTYNR